MTDKDSAGQSTARDLAFRMLALRYLEGMQDDEDAEKLSEELAASAEKREAFVALCVEVGLLDELREADYGDDFEIVAAPLESKVLKPAKFDRSRLLRGKRRLLQFSAVISACVGFLIGWLVGWSPEGKSHRDLSVPLADTRQVEPVAYLASANSCDWGGDSQHIWQVGRTIQSSDELTLYEGIAEFRLASGVLLSVEGPAALVMNSPTSLVVQHGKVTVHVPWSIAEFRVLASTCRITACDAEFGVNVSGNEVDAHAFTGEIVVSSSPFEVIEADEWEVSPENIDPVRQKSEFPDDRGLVKARVSQGRALKLRVSSDGVMRIASWHDANESVFATKLSMAGSLPALQSYANAVLQSRPVNYWRFESLTDGRVPCEVSPSNALRSVGEVRLVGDRWNRTAEFGRPGSEGHLVSSEPLDVLAGSDYSVEVWAKPSHSHRGGLAALVPNPHTEHPLPTPANLHAFSVELTGPGYLRSFRIQGLPDVDRSRIRFLHRAPPSGDPHTGTACFSAKAYALRRWQQIVTVKEGPAMRLYVDGNLVAKNEDSTNLTDGLFLEVGRFIGTSSVLQFVGQLDELSIYNRALSESEIQRHYELIRWDSKNQPPGRMKGV